MAAVDLEIFLLTTVSKPYWANDPHGDTLEPSTHHAHECTPSKLARRAANRQ